MTSDLSARDTVRKLTRPSESNLLAYRANSYELFLGDLISSLFSNNGISPVRIPQDIIPPCPARIRRDGMCQDRSCWRTVNILQINDFPLDPAADQYQLNRPVQPADPPGQFGGLGVNLYSALSSISRYDDSKCVSRILCEMASGRRPGQYERASSSYLGDLGRNVLAQCVLSCR